MPISVPSLRLRHALAALLLILAGFVLAACQGSNGIPKDMRPLPAKLTARMEKLNMDPKAPIYIRSYKETSEFEVWKQRRDGQYALLSTYQICKWSGKLGPKIREGDRQAPEGFYTIKPGQMNPKSNYFLSFNIGFPNAFDSALGRTGTNLMVHGACSSAGCYSMTDEAAGEIYWLARDAFLGGQRSFEVHLYPFRMTPENMAKHRNDPNMEFWVMLKEGSDHFEVTRKPPVVGVCNRRYVFDVDTGGVPLNASAPCPANMSVPVWLDAAVKEKQAKDQVVFASLSAKYDAEDKIAAETAAADAQKLAAKTATDQQKAVAEAQKSVDAATMAVEPPVAAAGGDATAAYTAAPALVEANAATASVAVGGVPAPGVPLPVPSPIRPVVVAPPPQPEAPAGFWGKLKKKLAVSG
ncbi:murein L,D-transpeptidase [Kaistia dalseonensis]|uniref:Murein L,D-transpeptidase YafK n=1 Tax=Kaistia dalseonensis TaxID=410840 RepID=A0ABU0H3J9_9HYPH|nr:murein L,D-transpeptidase family protein [Kaistia dalseonensis]MCX5494301.1 murein L,D-transpeptidase [Kaistia dalseonensis]MDQ0436882.1 murein L,D-transpeptidase YafK [Kaistia dalseonensis]